MTKRITTHEAAKRLGVCHQRIASKIRQGHFPTYGWCECGRSLMIPEIEVEAQKKTTKRKNKNV